MNSKEFSSNVKSLTFTYKSSNPISLKLELFDALKCFTEEITKTNEEKKIFFKEGEIKIQKLCSKEFKHFVFQIKDIKKETTIDFSIKNEEEEIIDQDLKILKPNLNGNTAICYIFHNHINNTWNYLQLNYPNEDLYFQKNKPKTTSTTTITRKLIPFHFIEQTEIINIKILNGNDLAIQDLNGFSDPYCVVYIGKSKLKTSVKFKTLNPIWEEQLDFKISNPGSIEQIIIDCWDYDLAKTHDFLGQIIIDPKTLELKKKLKINLKKREKKKDSHVKGNIILLFDINNKDTISEHKLNLFGISMIDVMQRNNETEKYPKKIKSLVDYLMKHGPGLEGIFRKTASVSQVKELSNKLDSGEEISLDNSFENYINTIASLFKLYIRELPDPLLTWELYDQFLNVSKEIKEEEKKIFSYSKLLTEIPFFNRGLLFDLMTLCNKINDNNKVNLMNFKNLAVIFGICLLTTKDDLKNAKNIGIVQDVCIDLMKMHPKHFEIAEKLIQEEADAEED